jgi:hypothetical protein
MRDKRLILLVALLLLSPFARGDEASKRDNVRELFRVMRLQNTMAQLMSQTMEQSEKMSEGLFDQSKMTDAERQRNAQFLEQVRSRVERYFGWESLEPQYIELYASTYSEEEIDGILAFYNSAVGKSMLEKTPMIMSKSSAIVQERSAEVQPELRALMQEYIAQIAADKKATPQQ